MIEVNDLNKYMLGFTHNFIETCSTYKAIERDEKLADLWGISLSTLKRVLAGHSSLKNCFGGEKLYHPGISKPWETAELRKLALRESNPICKKCSKRTREKECIPSESCFICQRCSYRLCHSRKDKLLEECPFLEAVFESLDGMHVFRELFLPISEAGKSRIDNTRKLEKGFWNMLDSCEEILMSQNIRPCLKNRKVMYHFNKIAIAAM